MSCAYIAFTETGLKLAEKLASSHPGNISRGGKSGIAKARQPIPL